MYFITARHCRNGNEVWPWKPDPWNLRQRCTQKQFASVTIQTFRTPQMIDTCSTGSINRWYVNCRNGQVVNDESGREKSLPGHKKGGRSRYPFLSNMYWRTDWETPLFLTLHTRIDRRHFHTLLYLNGWYSGYSEYSENNLRSCRFFHDHPILTGARALVGQDRTGRFRSFILQTVYYGIEGSIVVALLWRLFELCLVWESGVSISKHLLVRIFCPMTNGPPDRCWWALNRNLSRTRQY